MHKVHKVKIVRDGKELSKEEREEMIRELREGMADMERGLAEAKREIHVAMVDLNDAKAGATVIKIRCDDGEDGIQLHSPDGEIERVCTSEIMASALSGLEQARASIAQEKEMSEEIRKDVLRELDREIARMKKEKAG